ncbi:hypothetical protein [Kitasatospora sp. NPDC002965]|uniref:hypothetical protein n=1 Tax=Kitasatospora sp. NPDC002965 TaxID=3154775 RepID=UPI0033B3B94F
MPLGATDPDTPAVRNLVGHPTIRSGDSGDGCTRRGPLAREAARSRLEPGRGEALERAIAACVLAPPP